MARCWTTLTRGICYVVYGFKARNEFQMSSRTLQHFNKIITALVADDKVNGRTKRIRFTQPEHYTNIQKSRWAKVNLDQWSPFQQTLYLDADTRIRGDVSLGFDILNDGFDLVICPSIQQANNILHHVGEDDKEHTLQSIGYDDALQFQGGVFYFRKSRAMRALFETWREEWLRFENQDQGALIRALHRQSVKIWILSNVWNGGAIICHRHGQAVTRRV